MKRTSTNFHPLFFSFIFYCEKNLFRFSPFILPLYFLLLKGPLQIFTLYSSPLFSTVKRTSTDFHPLFFPFIFYFEKNLYKFSPFILPLYFLLLKEPLKIFTLNSSPLFSTVKRTSTNFHPLFLPFIFYCEKNLYKFSPCIPSLYFLLWKEPLQIFTLYSSPLFSTVKRTSTDFHPLFFPFIFYC